MLHIKFLATFCILLPLCSAIALFDKQTKCSVKDNDCQAKVIQNIIDELSESGVPEFNIPKIDPYPVNKLELDVLGMIHVSLVKGSVEGVKSCSITSYELKVENLHATVDLTCERIKMEGDYGIKNLPALQAIVGDVKIQGDGTGSVEIDKIHTSFIFPFEFRKNDDGEIHLHIKHDEATHTAEVVNKVTFTGNSLSVGSVEISTQVIAIMNENWKVFTKSFGQLFINTILDTLFTYLANAIEAIPAKLIFSDDLSQYV